MLKSDEADMARSELWRQSADQHLDYPLRVRSWQYLVELDRAITERATTYHRGIFEDEDESIGNRAIAAHQLSRLDPRHKYQAFRFLRRVIEDPQVLAEDRYLAVETMHRLGSLATDVFDPMLSAVVRDRWLTPEFQRPLAMKLPRKLRTEIERVLLADHSLPIEERLPRHDIWRDLPLVVVAEAEAEAEARDVLTQQSPARGNGSPQQRHSLACRGD
jgi:cellulose synthase operon protein C